MKTSKIKFLLCMALPVLLLSSCVSGELETGGKASGGTATVRVSLQMPAASPKTYAITETDENDVRTIDVLAFKPVEVSAQHPSGWAYAYKAEGASISNQSGSTAGNTKQFTVTLVKSSAQQLFVVLANVRSEVTALGDIAVGADRDALLEELVVNNTGPWNTGGSDDFRPFPMWGEQAVTLTDAVTEITGVGMLRSIARLDVVLSDAVVTAGNFSLKEIYLYNSKHAGYVVPAPANLSAGEATAATVPAVASDYAGWNTPTPLVYTVPPAMHTAFERTMYLFEAKAVTRDKAFDATCIVVGGIYGSDATLTTYYRLDFLAADGTSYKDVLRNHKYRVHITEVNGEGYATAEEAFNAAPFNMEAVVIAWNDQATDMVYDGQYAFGTSAVNGILTYGADAVTDKVKVQASHPSGWQIEGMTDDQGTDLLTAATPWLTLTPGSGTSGAPAELALTLTAYTGTSQNRTATVVFSAGNLRYTLTVIQKPADVADMMITDESGNDLNGKTLSFAPTGATLKNFRVKWTPASKDVAVAVMAVPGAGASGFEFEPANDISNGTIAGGTQNYSVKPTDMGTGESYAYKTSVVVFTLSDNQGNNIVKSVFLAQGNFTIKAPTEVSMPLTGTEQSFLVKANTGWKISSVTYHKPDDSTCDKSDLFTVFDETQSQATGDPVNGQALTFTPINSTDPAMNGYYALVTLHDDNGRASDVTVKIIAAVCGANGTAIASAIGTKKTYLTHYYGTGTNRRCWMVENSMEGTASATCYNNDAAQVNGYYYTWTQAANACPAGWKLPESADFNMLKDAVNADLAGVGRWWAGPNGPANNAFAGFYFIFNSSWYNWGGYGYWRSSSASDQYFHGGTSGMYGPTTDSNYWFSVRCVRDL